MLLSCLDRMTSPGSIKTFIPCRRTDSTAQPLRSSDGQLPTLGSSSEIPPEAQSNRYATAMGVGLLLVEYPTAPAQSGETRVTPGSGVGTPSMLEVEESLAFDEPALESAPAASPSQPLDPSVLLLFKTSGIAPNPLERSDLLLVSPND